MSGSLHWKTFSLFAIAFTEQAESAYRKLRTDRLANCIADLAKNPAPNGKSIFANPKAKSPYDGDFIFQIRDGNRFVRFRFILDRQEMRLTIVAVVPLPLLM